MKLKIAFIAMSFVDCLCINQGDYGKTEWEIDAQKAAVE